MAAMGPTIKGPLEREAWMLKQVQHDESEGEEGAIRMPRRTSPQPATSSHATK